MHGLVNKAIEAFVRDTYGDAEWNRVASMAQLMDVSFEAMMVYDEAITPEIVNCAIAVLKANRTDFLQNLGTYLVSHPSAQNVRRLLRFGGVDFVEFLYSLDDLRDRAKLAVADLDLPQLELREFTAHQFSLTIRSGLDGFGHVMVGLLTAMADDYGSLVMIEHGGRKGTSETVAIALLDAAFTAGNHFELGVRL